MIDTPAAPGEGTDHVIVADTPAVSAQETDKKLDRPCCRRLSRGGWCLLADGHEGGLHVGIRSAK